MSRAWGSEGHGQGPAVGRDDLIAYLRSGSKEPAAWLLGLEQEKLGVRPDGTALPFYGKGGVEEVLHSLESWEGFQGRRERDTWSASKPLVEQA